MRSIEEVCTHRWYVFTCAKCESTNWFYSGNNESDQDLSGIDPEGVKCHKCGEIYHFLDDVMIEMKKKDDPDWENNLDLTDGQKKPG
jgi:hypothetical protein